MRLKRLRFLLCGAAAYFICASVVHGEARFEAWTSDDGLPQNSVYSILQTRDGYLWFTTLGGLVRYDGVRFTVFNKSNSAGIASNRFTALYEDAWGSLWIGTYDGGLSRIKNGNISRITMREGLYDNGAFQILEDDGNNF